MFSNEKAQKEKTRKLAKEVSRLLKRRYSSRSSHSSIRSSRRSSRRSPGSDSELTDTESSSEPYGARSRKDLKRKYKELVKSGYSKHSDEVKRIKRKLRKMEDKYRDASESSEDVKQLKRVVERLSLDFNKARTDLVKAATKRAFADATRLNIPLAQIPTYVSQYVMQSTAEMAPGLSAAIPMNPSMFQATVATAIPMASAVPMTADMALQAQQNEVAKQAAMREAAERVARHYDVNRMNDEAVQQYWYNTKAHAANALGAVTGLPANLASTGVNVANSWMTKLGQKIGLSG